MIKETNLFIWGKFENEDEEVNFQEKCPTFHSTVDEDFENKMKSLDPLRLSIKTLLGNTQKKSIENCSVYVFDYNWKEIDGENVQVPSDYLNEDGPVDLVDWYGHLAYKNGDKMIFLPKDKYIQVNMEECKQ